MEATYVVRDTTWLSASMCHLGRYVQYLVSIQSVMLQNESKGHLPRCLGVTGSSAGIHLAKCTEWSLIQVASGTVMWPNLLKAIHGQINLFALS